MDDEQAKSLWIKIRWQTNIGTFLWVSATDALFGRRQKMRPPSDNWKDSCLQALILKWTT